LLGRPTGSRQVASSTPG